MMQFLSVPEPDLASRILAEVGYEHRLVGYRCRPRWGQLAANLYSVQHIARLLGDKYPALSFAELEKWLRTVVRDDELANRVAQTIEEQASNRDKVLRVKTLLEERLSQCKSLRTAQTT